MSKKKYFKICLIIWVFIILFNNISFGVNINVPNAIVIDNNTGRVLYEKDGYEKVPMASLTKIMTSIVLIENCMLDEIVNVPDSATYIGGSELGLKKGDTISVYNLLVGMLLPSGNDAALTAAVHVGGSLQGFSKLMNDKAKSIGAINTNFENPHGLDSENHYSTAYDLALITRYAINNKTIRDIISSKNITVSFGNTTKTVKNTNRLLGISYINGGKTGFTGNANRCLILTADNTKMSITSIVLGANTTDLRFGMSKTLIEESFKTYTMQDISNTMHFYINIPIIKGDDMFYESSIDIDEYMFPLKELELEKIYVKQNVLKELDSSFKKGDKIGDISLCIEDEEIYVKEIFLDYDIKSKSSLSYFKEIFDVINRKVNKLDI